jgi:hypothetical protein
VTYYTDFLADVREGRTGGESRVTEGTRVFDACRMALRCQNEAEIYVPA